MGLDITAYRGLKEEPSADLDEHGYPADHGLWTAADVILDFTEKHFPGRTEGVRRGVVYRPSETFSFRAGSYGGYGDWRDGLAEFASGTDAFAELINFADNEGIIGPIVAAKLAKDFRDNAGRAATFGDAWWRARYADWQRAFEMAADGGAVDFH